MFNETFREVAAHEGVVSIVSCADGEAHVANTWNSYLVMADGVRLLIPAWKMRKTEEKVLKNPKVLLTLGSREVKGRMGPGTGFLLEGAARFVERGEEFAMMKERFPFLTRVLEVTVTGLRQTI
ncbi:FMN-binding protein [Fundidesulfovibrio magnetotacticus]|uniref:FMN-binding protein n=1 Tax=Fundidesulfovibrio magnetotacticus TaxID=2730080 RepID=A0A6V8LQY0_9BACT|nr:pyridoxamine 5'-phosphate oxidase family protein [Fundidesulfovibrio magnetotacticus]GFK92748.1 FMN-binding protein [Fundidesulfovibrio magnetotacticus]